MTTTIDKPATGREVLRWVPIRALAERHRPRLLAHLLGLDVEDRHLRFGYAAGDAQIGRYVDQIDFERDEVFGIFNRRLEVVAMAHLAYLGRGDQPPTVAEFGVSVAARARGRGWGARLFERAALQARNRQVTRLLINSLAENKAMLHIVRAAGATIGFEGPDAVAHLDLMPQDMASHLVQMVEHQAAEFDYGMKLQVQRVDAWLRLLGSARALPAECPPGSGDPGGAALTQPRGPAPLPPV